MSDILKEAHRIVYERDTEKEKEYGDFSEGMQRTAKIASLMCNKEITTNDCYNVLIALKLAREAHAHKEDNLLDAIAYIAQKNEDLTKV